MTSITLPVARHSLERYNLSSPGYGGYRPSRGFTRQVYAAAHVVVDPAAETDPWTAKPALDWEATMAYRRHLWSMGFKVAEAMDTSQRGMGLDWPSALELIGRSLEAARDVPGADLASGAGTDHLTDLDHLTLDDVRRAFIEQIEAVEKLGGRIILMASRALAAVAEGPDDYLRIYGELIDGCSQPVILHWLGEVFDPALAGYWGSNHIDACADTVLSIIQANPAKVDGIKVSLLEKRYEIDLRKRLPADVLMYTGDDFSYPELMAGDDSHFSHGLLGIFDSIAPVAAQGLERLAAGDTAGFLEVLEPTVPLARKIFEAPTQFYKAGVVFLAWLNGHQDHFTLVAGLQSARSIRHYGEVFRLADQAGLLRDPELAARRMAQLLAVYGIEADA
jgi:hypothetical protein